MMIEEKVRVVSCDTRRKYAMEVNVAGDSRLSQQREGT